MNTYDFPVKLIPIKAENILIPNKVAVIREDTSQPIGVVSSQYGLLKHQEVIECFRKALKKTKHEEKIMMTKNGAHLIATYKLPEAQMEVKKGDLVSMQFIVKNSYDGTKSFSLMLGAFRLVCSNGMIIGKEIFTYSQRHFSGNAMFGDANGIIETKIPELISHFKEALPIMKAMTKTILTESTEMLFEKETLELPKYLIAGAKDIYEKTKEKTLWEYYNSLTFAISHNLKKDSPQSQLDYTKRVWKVAMNHLPVKT